MRWRIMATRTYASPSPMAERKYASPLTWTPQISNTETKIPVPMKPKYYVSGNEYVAAIEEKHQAEDYADEHENRELAGRKTEYQRCGVFYGHDKISHGAHHCTEHQSAHPFSIKHEDK